MAATAQVPVRPATENPSGTRPTTSRWLIQTCCVPAEAAEQRVGRIVEFERRQPVLALHPLADFAAQQVRHELLPVADAEHRDAQRKDRRVHRGALRVVYASSVRPR